MVGSRILPPIYWRFSVLLFQPASRCYSSGSSFDGSAFRQFCSKHPLDQLAVKALIKPVRTCKLCRYTREAPAFLRYFCSKPSAHWPQPPFYGWFTQFYRQYIGGSHSLPQLTNRQCIGGGCFVIPACKPPFTARNAKEETVPRLPSHAAGLTRSAQGLRCHRGRVRPFALVA